MPFVVDASVAASWLLPDEGRPEALRAYARLVGDHAVVPSLWWFEVRNLFVVNERRGRVDREQTRQALSLLAALPIELDFEPVEATLLHFARQHRLTAYDAAYLELAKRYTLPLATLDKALATAARAELVTLIGD
jgi:predicted nucleic acid-binding protein